MDEVSRGELEDPFELSEIPSHCPLSRRFGVQQNQKVRCVDDFSWSGVNSTAQPLACCSDGGASFQSDVDG